MTHSTGGLPITRHEFLRIGGAAAASVLVKPFGADAASTGTFFVALIADTHIIDSFYKGPEGNAEDASSLFKTSERLEAARRVINRLCPAVDATFLIGDFFHNYPSPDVDFYFRQTTRIDRAKTIAAGFHMPVHVGFGNHDYGDAGVPREMCHELFRRKLGLRPYYAVTIKGWKFIHVNNFLGSTWDRRHPSFDIRVGSLGEEQLNWLEAELGQQKPTMVFVHFPLPIVQPTEVKDYGLYSLLKRYRTSIQRVVSGHWHRWFNFGRAYGPPHLVMAATRYDENAYLIVQIDSKTAQHELLNIDLVQWDTHFSAPYQPRGGGAC